MTTDDDDDFWATYIAATPDEDQHFAGCGPWLLVLIGLAAVVVMLALI